MSDPEALFEAELAGFLRQLSPGPDAAPPRTAGTKAGQPGTDPGHPN
ncbi:hypothetical protein [Plantactinospora soyae]|uniref:Uncharacterized protein n=1 Tax=Plantactinospora soyae TaxID=1544732 RepID=A0A927QYH0_9ACTN|nr:hypothetical protein [Plantactinospora soyae]MBE1487862.1 hypothetical protein [Plantactinospora soyae]